MQGQQRPMANGHPQPAANGTQPLALAPMPVQQVTNPTPTPVSFTPELIGVLKAQIAAFKYIQANQPIPEHFRQSVQVNNTVVSSLEKSAQPTDIHGRIIDSAVKVAKGESGTPAPTGPSPDEVKAEELDALPANPADYPKGPFLEDNQSSAIYPYNAYRHPFTHLKRSPETDPAQFHTRLQRLLVPTIMPAGLDAHQVFNERERFIDARVQQRIRELENLPATIGDGGFDAPIDVLEEDTKAEDKENESGVSDHLKTYSALIHPSGTAHGKLRALIELKSLRLLDKQRTLRASIAERLTHGTMLPLNRHDFRRSRKPQVRDVRQTEHQERTQRADRERRAKYKHVEQLGVICNHGKEVIHANRAAQDRVNRIGRAVLAFHTHTEKEEQKRIERLAKERLKALKADDEEAYMKLIDTAKDTRITHLLRQTDAYLDSLAQAVISQQTELGGLDFETEDGPANENTFGARVADDIVTDNAKIDYYAVAHRVSEKISAQPAILVGGKLKEYQLKGLQWMVSLYNNRLNGILADEMVRAVFFVANTF